MALSYLERPAPALLAPYIECVWEVGDRRAAAGRAPERIVPDGCPELIVHLGDAFARRAGTHWRRQPRAFLAGTLTRPWLVRAGRRVLTLGIRFRPAAVIRVLGPGMVADREVALAAMVGRSAARALVERLRSAPSTDARLSAAERWLGERLEAAAPTAPGAHPAVALILRARGRIRIASSTGSTTAGRCMRGSRASCGERPVPRSGRGGRPGSILSA